MKSVDELWNEFGGSFVHMESFPVIQRAFKAGHASRDVEVSLLESAVRLATANQEISTGQIKRCYEEIESLQAQVTLLNEEIIGPDL